MPKRRYCDTSGDIRSDPNHAFDEWQWMHRKLFHFQYRRCDLLDGFINQSPYQWREIIPTRAFVLISTPENTMVAFKTRRLCCETVPVCSCVIILLLSSNLYVTSLPIHVIGAVVPNSFRHILLWEVCCMHFNDLKNKD